MFKLVPNRSYLWAFPIWLVVLVGISALCVAVGHFSWATMILPGMIAALLSCELRSEVALDSYWRDSHVRGTWQYRAAIAWQAFSFFASLAMCYIAISQLP